VRLRCSHVCLHTVYRCRDCTFESTCPSDGDCGKAAWKEDGFCDDGNNNCGCNWDGGDCCDSASNFDYCSDCYCLDPNEIPDGSCGGSCWSHIYSGDGFCDDANNNCACDWDGGDCCLVKVLTTYCDDCLCLEP